MSMTTDSDIPNSIQREFTPIISNLIGYLIGIGNIPMKYMDNVELETEYANGSLQLNKVYYWVDDNPVTGFVPRSDINKKILFDIDNNRNYVPSHYEKIINFMLNLVNPRLGSRDGEVIYSKYLVGRRLFSHNINDTTRHYYWYGYGSRISNSNELEEYFSDSSYSD